MPDRRSEITRFIAGAGWAGADVMPLAGDASARNFFRLRRDEGSAILMDDPGISGGATERFVALALWLRSEGFSAPDVLAADPPLGLALVEDLGDALVARVSAQDPVSEPAIYAAAARLLPDLQSRAPPRVSLARLDGPGLAALVAEAVAWYLGALDLRPEPIQDIPERIADAWNRLSPPPLVLALRDFHAQNLIWLPQRHGNACVGLLDFQDAVLAHPVYDLVSLVEDARRDVSNAARAAAEAAFVKAAGLEQSLFRQSMALHGAQRALRILGVFARLAQRGKPGYLELMPRVWAHLDRALDHPSLAGLAGAVRKTIPEPTPERRTIIKDRCTTHPTP